MIKPHLIKNLKLRRKPLKRSDLQFYEAIYMINNDSAIYIWLIFQYI